ncbi:MAG TPA: hypothetical protein VF070_42755 [Streptosporangiaceae bacterium]
MNDLSAQFEARSAVRRMKRLDASANPVPCLENGDIHSVLD